MTQRVINIPWADTGAVTDPGASKTADGWIAEIPTHQNFNWILNRADEAIQNAQETGVEPWHALVIFQDHALTVGTDGIVYKSQQATNTNHNPVGDDGTWWRPLVATSDIGGSVYGLEIALAADADHDITTSPGGCPAKNVFLDTAITKRLDAAFSAGDTGGGLSDGASDVAAADTTYHIHLISLDTTNVLDVYFDVDKGAANIPAGYSHMCRITSLYTDASANWIGFTNSGDEFRLKSMPATVANAPPGTSAVTPTLDVPIDIQVLAHLTVNVFEENGVLRHILVTSMDQDDDAPSSALFTVKVDPEATNNSISAYSDKLLTDTSGRFRHRSETSSAGYTVYHTLSGWTDHRRGLS
ncbi:MAG: hypothetical protein V3V08_05415 [Nannocystaceae bacterium]